MATINNRKARHDYLILDSFEAGIMLAGAEVKSIREGRATLGEAYARVQGGEVWLLGMHVSPYSYSRGDLDPVRPRKLLLHLREIDELHQGDRREGHHDRPAQAVLLQRSGQDRARRRPRQARRTTSAMP